MMNTICVQKKPMVCLIALSDDLANVNVAYLSSLGLRFFRLRLLKLLQSMFVWEPIHFAATFLHPRYRFLRRCSDGKIKVCRNYIRKEMEEIDETAQFEHAMFCRPSTSEIQDFNEPPVKRKKDLAQNMNLKISAMSTLIKKTKSSLIYQCKSILKWSMIIHCPFGRPIESSCRHWQRLQGRSISFQPTTACVEREFSAGGLVVTERRSALSPESVNNIIFLRSATRWTCLSELLHVAERLDCDGLVIK